MDIAELGADWVCVVLVRGLLGNRILDRSRAYVVRALVSCMNDQMYRLMFSSGI